MHHHHHRHHQQHEHRHRHQVSGHHLGRYCKRTFKEEAFEHDCCSCCNMALEWIDFKPVYSDPMQSDWLVVVPEKLSEATSLARHKFSTSERPSHRWAFYPRVQLAKCSTHSFIHSINRREVEIERERERENVSNKRNGFPKMGEWIMLRQCCLLVELKRRVSCERRWTLIDCGAGF